MNIIQSFTHRLSDLIKQYPLAMSFIFISTAFIPWIQDESISRDMIVVLLLPIYFSTVLLLNKRKYANGLAIAYAILITLAFILLSDLSMIMTLIGDYCSFILCCLLPIHWQKRTDFLCITRCHV